MRKRAAVALAIVLWVLPVVAQEQSDRTTYSLKGPVRSVVWTTSKYEERAGKWVEGPKKLSSKFTFDVKGNFIEDVRYMGDGRKNVAVYVRGKSTTNTVYKANGSIESREVTTLDERGRISVTAMYNGRGRLAHKMIYRYQGERLIEIDTVSADGSLQIKSVYVYDGNHVTEMIQYNGDGSLIGKRMYSVDFKENKSETASYSSDGSYMGKVINTTSSGDSKKKVSERFYYNTDGSLERKESFISDDKGQTLEVAGYKADGTIEYKWRPVYEYDLHGNWTKETTLTWVTKNGKSFFEPTHVSYRTITYY